MDNSGIEGRSEVALALFAFWDFIIIFDLIIVEAEYSHCVKSLSLPSVLLGRLFFAVFRQFLPKTSRVSKRANEQEVNAQTIKILKLQKQGRYK